MSQTAALRALDASIVGAMFDAGWADSVVYANGGSGIVCKALIDRGVQLFGEGDGGVVGKRTLITLFLSEIPIQTRGATITLGSEQFLLDEIEAQDESMIRWIVLNA